MLKLVKFSIGLQLDLNHPSQGYGETIWANLMTHCHAKQVTLVQKGCVRGGVHQDEAKLICADLNQASVQQ